MAEAAGAAARAFMIAILDTASSMIGSSRMCFGSGFTLRWTSCLPPLRHQIGRLQRRSSVQHQQSARGAQQARLTAGGYTAACINARTWMQMLYMALNFRLDCLW